MDVLYTSTRRQTVINFYDLCVVRKLWFCDNGRHWLLVSYKSFGFVRWPVYLEKPNNMSGEKNDFVIVYKKKSDEEHVYIVEMISERWWIFH